MENLVLGADKHSRAALADGSDNDTLAKLSADLWHDLQQATEHVQSAIKTVAGNETIKRIFDSVSSAAAAAVAPKEADWTIAIDFTTDFGHGQGVQSGLENLHAFAKHTKDKNITIVAQAAIPDTDEYDWFTGEPVIKPDTKYRLERYVVKDGEAKYIGDVDSKGYGADLQGLLEFASKNHPSKKTALIMDSHGTGNEGLLGDTGKISVDDFVKAVQNGLKGSGHEKIDMIDFDACLMAANGAISKIRTVADQVVASAETEGIYNGQNYFDPIRRLADNPKSDGFTLARDIVTQTHKEMEDWKKGGWNPSVETLSHLNLREYDEFRKSLDRFGDLLAESLKEKGNKEAIEGSIDGSRKYGGSGSLMATLFGKKLALKHRTDLREFTESVIRAVDNGEINDPDRILKKAAQDLLTKRGNLVDSYHGEGAYSNAGGLSVFLPGKNLRNTEKEAALYTTAGRMSEMTDNKHFAQINKDDKTRKEFVEKIKEESWWTRPRFFDLLGVHGVDKELDKVDKSIEAFTKAKDDKERAACFKDLHQASVELANTEPFKKQYQAELKSLNEKIAKVYTVNNIDDSNGWSRFRMKLRESK